MRFTAKPGGPTIGSNSSFLPLNRWAAESARLIAPSVASSSRLADGVSTASPQTPTTTSPDRGSSASAKLISMVASGKFVEEIGRERSALRIAIGRTTRQVNARVRRRRNSRMRLAGPHRVPYDPRLMRRLDRYILRQCFGVMLFVTAALSAAIWLAQSLRLIDLIVNRGLSVDIFLYLALLILPRFLDIVLPIGVFIAVLFTFSRLTAESELVVMRSAGLSHVALAKPVLMLAGIAFVILMSLSAYFLPASHGAFKDLQFEIRSRFASSLVQEGTFTTISDKLTIYIRSRGDRGEVTGLLIHDNREPKRPVTILA